MVILIVSMGEGMAPMVKVYQFFRMEFWKDLHRTVESSK